VELDLTQFFIIISITTGILRQKFLQKYRINIHRLTETHSACVYWVCIVLFRFLSSMLATSRIKFLAPIGYVNRRLLEKCTCWKVTVIKQLFGCQITLTGLLKWCVIVEWKNITEDMESPSSEASGKDCSKLSQVWRHTWTRLEV